MTKKGFSSVRLLLNMLCNTTIELTFANYHQIEDTEEKK